jgi:hypothetical protein
MNNFFTGLPTFVGASPSPSLLMGDPAGEHKHRDLVRQIGGLNARLTNLLCHKIIVAKSKEMKAGWSDSQEWTNLAGYSMKGYVTERAVQETIMITLL